MVYYQVYSIFNTINGKVYVGKHKIDTMNKKNYFGSGKAIKFAIKKYGKSNFEKTILEYCENEEAANWYERKYILWYRRHGKCEYNIADGGEGGNGGGNLGKRHTEETKKKMSISRKGKKSWNKGITKIPDKYCISCGKKLSNKYQNTTDYCFKCCNKLHKKPCSGEKKEKLRISNIGKKHNCINKPCGFKNGKHSKETIEKIRARSLGSHWYTNGIINKYQKECPEGFYLGKAMNNIKKESI